MDEFELSPDTTEGELLKEKKKAFKSICFRMGLALAVMFASRTLTSVIAAFIYSNTGFSSLSLELQYLVSAAISAVGVYAIPILFTWWILRKDKPLDGDKMFAKPQHLNRAVFTFAPIYAIAMTVNLLTILIARLFMNEQSFTDYFNTMQGSTPNSMVSALILLFQFVVMAPVLEEIWFRGIIMRKLLPYGSGFAIFISALIFGLAHGNFRQFFFATVIGIAFGYIAYSTKSIFSTMILHAMVNSVAGIIVIFLSTKPIQELINGTFSGSPADTPEILLYYSFMVVILVIIFIGLFMAAVRIPKIKRYRTPAIWGEMPMRKKLGGFFFTISFATALVLIIDVFSGNYFTAQLLQALGIKS